MQKRNREPSRIIHLWELYTAINIQKMTGNQLAIKEYTQQLIKVKSTTELRYLRAADNCTQDMQQALAQVGEPEQLLLLETICNVQREREREI